MDRLKGKKWIILILVVNLIGAGYGFYRFVDQLSAAPVQFWLFIPDSPLFMLFFAVAALGIWKGKRSGTFEFITWMGMIKYSMWTIFTLLLGLEGAGNLQGGDQVILILNMLMFIEGIALTLFLGISLKHLLLAAVVFVTADCMDWFTPVHYFGQSLGVYPVLVSPFHYSVAKMESWVSTIGLLGIAGFLMFMDKRAAGKNKK